jgi:CRP-like cAMP-binding protein
MATNIDVGAISAISIFSGIPSQDLAVLLELADTVELGAGEVLFSEDAPAHSFYVLLSGGIDVFGRGSGAADRLLAHLAAGSAIGETSLLMDGLRSATARATERSRLLRFPDERFHDLLEAGSLPAYRLVANLARVLAARLRAADDELLDAASRRGTTTEEEDDLDRLRRIFFKDWGL